MRGEVKQKNFKKKISSFFLLLFFFKKLSLFLQKK